ncbi:hypothetical protein COU60_02745 [Candidatus Pacearchaeota archaeon CG10_big_fil_rev_8_21_14_0_10_34_76]|nr:MAG: hypothetical protein COU60_02745 [Candidatus Pacearchaeota archaeon CG10_big_fil_rev_8_21_14_0_10_34_76]
MKEKKKKDNSFPKNGKKKGNRKNINKTRVTKKTTEDLVHHLSDSEELLYLISILDKREIDTFLGHYSKSKIKTKNKKLNQMLKKANNSEKLLKSLKKHIISSINERYSSIIKELKKKKKEKKETSIEQLKLIVIPSKIKLFESTFDKKDFYKIKRTLDEISISLKQKH